MIGMCLYTLIPGPTKHDVFVSKARALYFFKFSSMPLYASNASTDVLCVAVVPNGLGQNGTVTSTCRLLFYTFVD